MATTDIPSAAIKHQAQTITPVTGDDTLVDDPVALVDDPSALVGGPSTPTESVKSKVYSDRAKAGLDAERPKSTLHSERPKASAPMSR